MHNAWVFLCVLSARNIICDNLPMKAKITQQTQKHDKISAYLRNIPYLCSDNFAAPIGIVMMLCSNHIVRNSYSSITQTVYIL
jgi:hypothetical protein